MSEPAFWSQDLDDGNVMDLLGSIHRGDLRAIVSEAAGGIIAYALGDEPTGQIVAKLNSTELLIDIAAELRILAHTVDPHLESDEMNTLWSQIGRIELLIKENT